MYPLLMLRNKTLCKDFTAAIYMGYNLTSRTLYLSRPLVLDLISWFPSLFYGEEVTYLLLNFYFIYYIPSVCLNIFSYLLLPFTYYFIFT